MPLTGNFKQLFYIPHNSEQLRRSGFYSGWRFFSHSFCSYALILRSDCISTLEKWFVFLPSLQSKKRWIVGVGLWDPAAICPRVNKNYSFFPQETFTNLIPQTTVFADHALPKRPQIIKYYKNRSIYNRIRNWKVSHKNLTHCSFPTKS